MEASVDQDQKWLVKCLTAALDTNSEIRSFAEASLKQASLQLGCLLHLHLPGHFLFSSLFVVCLVMVMVINPVHGALRCLALLSSDLDDTVVPKLVPSLFPHLHTIISPIISSPHLYENSLRAKALSIVHSCISVLGSMNGVYKAETSSLMMPMLSSLMEQFSVILQSPVQSEEPDDWSIRMEVLKCLL